MIPPVFERTCVVVRVVDGDTLHIVADLGMDIGLAMTVRLYGLDCPENSTPEGKAATAFVTGWVGPPVAQQFTLRTVKDRKEKFGRYLADLIRPDGASLCETLLAEHYAVPYDGGAR